MSTKTWTGNAGDGNWATAGNWAEGSVPSAADDVFFVNGSKSVTAGLDQHTLNLNTLNINMAYTGLIGSSGVSGAYLQVSVGYVNIGVPAAQNGPATGSQRINIDVGSNPSIITVQGSATTAADTGESPVRVKGSSITRLVITGGVVGVATDPGETATIGVLAMSQTAAQPVLYLGSGAAVTEIDIAGGSLYDNSASTINTASITGGTYTKIGSGGINMLTVDGGAIYYGAGTIMTAYVRGTLDFSRFPGYIMVSGCTAYNGATINAFNGIPNAISFPNGIQLKGCRLDDVTIDVGYERTLSIS